jgi:hypothetical protein
MSRRNLTQQDIETLRYLIHTARSNAKRWNDGDRSFRSWKEHSAGLIKDVFSDPFHAGAFLSIRYDPGYFPCSSEQQTSSFAAGLDQAVVILQSALAVAEQEVSGTMDSMAPPLLSPPTRLGKGDSNLQDKASWAQIFGTWLFAPLAIVVAIAIYWLGRPAADKTSPNSPPLVSGADEGTREAMSPGKLQQPIQVLKPGRKAIDKIADSTDKPAVPPQTEVHTIWSGDSADFFDNEIYISIRNISVQSNKVTAVIGLPDARQLVFKDKQVGDFQTVQSKGKTYTVRLLTVNVPETTFQVAKQAPNGSP